MTSFSKRVYLDKLDVYESDIHKLKNLPNNLSNLKSKVDTARNYSSWFK